MGQAPGKYLSYLLRLWQTKRQGEWVWQASLESARARRRLSFPDLDALCRYLRRQTGETRATEEGEGGDKAQGSR
jgi:hypothetical protein